MELPPYFKKRPEAQHDAGTIALFEELYESAVKHGAGDEIDYSLDAPKWQFLCYLSDTKGTLLHGSGNPGIAEFEPRQSNDTSEFGNRRAVYAASDGIWPIYFAVMDRDRYVTSLMNACFRISEGDGKWSDPYYFFSINEDALPYKPWRTGTVYVLPRDGFQQQPPDDYRGVEMEIAQWASPVAVKPLAKLTVQPEDFPFLDNIYAHDPKVIQQKAALDRDGFPWLDDTSA